MESSNKRIKFRNYVPHDEKLLSKRIEENNDNAVGIDTIVSPSELLKQEIEAALKVKDDEEAAIIAPKKPNWDLKNQVAERLEKLQRRTQRAIVDLLREKIAKENEEVNLEQ